MALTETTKKGLGFKAPDFKLLDTVTQQQKALNELVGLKGTVVMFICNHCPYVVHVMDEIVKVANDYQNKGIGFIAISSNDVENYPADSPEKMNLFAQEYQFPFSYLYDETQQVAKAYDAACTPDFSVFNADLSCIYRGRLDDSTPGNGNPLTGKDLRAALDEMLNSGNAIEPQYPSMGCNIKWKK